MKIYIVLFRDNNDTRWRAHSNMIRTYTDIKAARYDMDWYSKYNPDVKWQIFEINEAK